MESEKDFGIKEEFGKKQHFEGNTEYREMVRTFGDNGEEEWKLKNKQRKNKQRENLDSWCA